MGMFCHWLEVSGPQSRQAGSHLPHLFCHIPIHTLPTTTLFYTYPPPSCYHHHTLPACLPPTPPLPPPRCHTLHTMPHTPHLATSFAMPASSHLPYLPAASSHTHGEWQGGRLLPTIPTPPSIYLAARILFSPGDSQMVLH